MKKVTKEQYDQMVKQSVPDSPVVKDCFLAFIFGGGLCVLGQVLCNLYQNMGLDIKDARAAVSLSLITIAALLTILKVYDKISKHAGAGMLVPITGFANSVVSCGIEFNYEGYVAGSGAKIFTIAGPVIVYGISASIAYGIIIYIMVMFGVKI